MKLLLTLALAIAVCGLRGSATAEDSGKDEPAFVHSWKMLHRGPPEVNVTSRATIETSYIEQKLDNFDETETRTWQMRYLSNSENFVAGGPMFIYLGGEWTISAGSISGGHFYDMAKEHNGYLFYTEHRYYGKSLPTSTITKDNLKYLHVKQALADLAHFIRTIKATMPELADSKVIISGCSYSATMVVWFKRLYPDLVDGGWASSAPILAKTDFREYKEVVGTAFRELGSQQCYDRIQKGIAELEWMFANKRGAEVKAMLKVCNNFDEHNDLDLWSLFGSISNIFSGIAQYQSEGDIPFYCDYLMSFDSDVDAIANFALWAFGSSSCLDMTYKSTVSYYLDSTYIYGASRPWYYQTCNEYGWYQSSGSANQPFGTKFPVTLYTTLCADVFGPEYTNEKINMNVDQTNVDFGGMNPEVQNIFMSHGGSDPWSAMGHTQLEGASVIPRASHCADLSSISSSDSAEMRASKELIAQRVREWVSGGTSDNAAKMPSDKARKYMRQLVRH